MVDAIVGIVSKAPFASLAFVVGVLLVVGGILGGLKWGRFKSEGWSGGKRFSLAVFGLLLLSLGYFSPYIAERLKHSDHVPVADLIVIEDSSPVALRDGDFKFYVKAINVHRLVGEPDATKRFATLAFGTRANLAGVPQHNVYPAVLHAVVVEGRVYQVSYKQMGQIDPVPGGSGRSLDFVLLTVEK